MRAPPALLASRLLDRPGSAALAEAGLPQVGHVGGSDRPRDTCGRMRVLPSPPTALLWLSSSAVVLGLVTAFGSGMSNSFGSQPRVAQMTSRSAKRIMTGAPDHRF